MFKKAVRQNNTLINLNTCI